MGEETSSEGASSLVARRRTGGIAESKGQSITYTILSTDGPAHLGLWLTLPADDVRHCGYRRELLAHYAKPVQHLQDYRAELSAKMGAGHSESSESDHSGSDMDGAVRAFALCFHCLRG